MSPPIDRTPVGAEPLAAVEQPRGETRPQQGADPDAMRSRFEQFCILDRAEEDR